MHSASGSNKQNHDGESRGQADSHDTLLWIHRACAPPSIWNRACRTLHDGRDIVRLHRVRIFSTAPSVQTASSPAVAPTVLACPRLSANSTIPPWLSRNVPIEYPPAFGLPIPLVRRALVCAARRYRVGAQVPIVLISRADAARARLASCAVAACCEHVPESTRPRRTNCAAMQPSDDGRSHSSAQTAGAAAGNGPCLVAVQ